MTLIKEIQLEQFSAFEELVLKDLGKINVLIGENDTGKTHLLKTIYAMTRSIEDYHRKEKSPEMKEERKNKGSSELLRDTLEYKLKWTFIPDPFSISSLIYDNQGKKKNKKSSLYINFIKASTDLKFELNTGNKDTIPMIHSNGIDKLKELSVVFIPAKEILTLFDAIQYTREEAELGAFDDTYYDLVKDFRLNAGRTRTTDEFKYLDPILGSSSFSYQSGELKFSKGNLKLSVHQAAEGIKKLLVAKQVLLNKRMVSQKQAVVLIDEPEANLHPKAVLAFAEFLSALAERDVQIFLATHSYFLIKRLEQLAIEKKSDYKLIDLRRNEDTQSVEARISCLKEGLTDNPIIQQSQALYEYDVDRLLNKG